MALPAVAQCLLEIATVKELKGTWADVTRSHRLIRNDVICNDSKVQRINSPTATNDDLLKLLSREEPAQLITFECKRLLGCEKPLDLTALANEEKRRLKGVGFLESFAQWKDSHKNVSHILSRRAPPTDGLFLKTIVGQAGKPIPITALFRAEAPLGTYQLDLCQRPTDDACGKTLPIPKAFAWRPDSTDELFLPPLPLGVSIIYRLRNDDPEIRTSDRVLAVGVDTARADRIAEANDKITVAGLSISINDPEQVAGFEDYVRSLAEGLTSH
jgi:hypothetical protein